MMDFDYLSDFPTSSVVLDRDLMRCSVGRRATHKDFGGDREKALISSGLLSLKHVLQSATGRVYGHLELFCSSFSLCFPSELALFVPRRDPQGRSPCASPVARVAATFKRACGAPHTAPARPSSTSLRRWAGSSDQNSFDGRTLRSLAPRGEARWGR